MKKFLFLFLILIFSNNVFAATTWITKKNSKASKVKTLEQMYVDGLLTRSECIKAKKKILKNQSIPGCKKEEESTVTYIVKKKKTKEVPEGPKILNFKGHIWNGKIVSKEYYCREASKSGMENWAYELFKKKGCVGTTKIVKIVPEKKEKKEVDIYVPEETQEDNIKPNIEIASTVTFKDPEYVLKGKVTDKGGSEKAYLFYQKGGGKKIRVKLENGEFKIKRFSLDNEEIKLIATDEYANETTKVVKIIIAMEEETEVVKIYDKPKPIIKGKKDNKRVAIIIGVESYENTPVKALYANNDAETFKDFANRSLGISKSNIKILIDSEAKSLDIVRALKLWLPKKITAPNQFELFVFFSGHGYPSEDEGLHLIPQNGDPRLLEESALSHRYIIDLIKKTKPKSVTMFIDACYSGQSNTGEVLVEGLKPLAPLKIDEDIPPNFNIFSSSESHRTSGTIKDAEHGIFSYYLMKGLEGKADENEDNKITNGEMIAYLKTNVSNEAFIQNREQNPQLKSENLDQILFRY